MCISVPETVLEMWSKTKYVIFLNFCIFHNLAQYFPHFFTKTQTLRNSYFYKVVESLKVIELQRCTIPHFKALYPLFSALAWLLTLGSIIFVLWSKTFVYFFFAHPLCVCLSLKIPNLNILLLRSHSWTSYYVLVAKYVSGARESL